MSVALIGLPGSGKSTVGRQLAKRLGLPFADSDQVIEKQLGCSIRDFFESHGEAKFRDLETEVIQDLALGACAAEGIEAKRVGREPNLGLLLRTVAVATAGKTGSKWDSSPPVAADALLPRRLLAHSCVLSTGGGAVLRETNRECLRSCCKVVYLHSSPVELFRRLRHDRTRPLLQVDDPLQRLKDLYAERDPLYRATAHFVIETGRPSVAMLVNMITMQLELSASQ